MQWKTVDIYNGEKVLPKLYLWVVTHFVEGAITGVLRARRGAYS